MADVGSRTRPVQLSGAATNGEIVNATTTGDLTINGVTNPVDMTLEAQLIGEAILVTGTTEIDFADFDVTTPSVAIVLAVEDHGIVEIQLWLSPAR